MKKKKTQELSTKQIEEWKWGNSSKKDDMTRTEGISFAMDVPVSSVQLAIMVVE